MQLFCNKIEITIDFNRKLNYTPYQSISNSFQSIGIDFNCWLESILISILLQNNQIYDFDYYYRIFKF